MKSRSLIIGALALSGLAIPATAAAQSDYGHTYNAPVQNVQCERQKKDDQLAGVLVGAIAGGLIGGAIGNNIDDGDAYRHHRHYRGYRGYRSHRGHGRHHRGNGNSDEVAAGAVDTG